MPNSFHNEKDELNRKVTECVIKFMKENGVTCEETIHQCDGVIQNAYDFMSDLFNLVESELNISEDEY